MNLHAPRKYIHHKQRHPNSNNSKPGPPPTTNILGTWYITRSSSPFWTDKRNVTINLSTDRNTGPIPINSLGSNATVVIVNTTSYQAMNSGPVRSTAGIDRVVTPFSGRNEGSITMEWRGSGWLRIASARWEILGWGGEEGDEWMVVFAEKSIFTPMGISLYSRRKGSITNMLWDGIERGLRGLVDGCSEQEREELRGLVEGIRVVRQD
ncbi:hypothetical protein BDV27DRAFT_124890 [Aspergillus caelatus]|uniref:Uncharacterized protein n=1 Tax=Aspergillus caelatus TaxID=61420 RepID=A0A5N7AA95_9EURO|nr:uncharacterized protein BDV27DRAFT_124890 [Aspergillus caelatus]KAE8366742.1 hypothetical protein BDV27DRAFT_124890 [Aspergillus caelatus]